MAALNRSLLIGFVIVLAVWSLHTYEFWFLEQGYGYLSSDAEVTAERIARLETEVRGLAENTKELRGGVQELVRELRRD